jgi:hypothetical protein
MRLCDGARTVAAIVEEIGAKYSASDRASVGRGVLDFLNAMADRCLIEDAA